MTCIISTDAYTVIGSFVLDEIRLFLVITEG